MTNQNSDFTYIQERITQLKSQLPTDITLIAISKGMPTDAIRAAYAAGQRHFGENRVAEASHKRAQLADLSDCIWHEIGHLQSKKVRQALQVFDYIDSVDTLKLAQRIDRIAGELSCHPSICLQVKLAPDPNKFGWSATELLKALPLLDQLEHLTIHGLMTILPANLKPTEISHLFQRLANLREQICSINLPRLSPTELSMGMSEDYSYAIEAGATQIRIGSLIFKRSRK